MKFPRPGAASVVPLAVSAYFVVAGSPRFRASQRRRILDSTRHAMVLTVLAAVANCVWLTFLHPDAAATVLPLNGFVMAVAVGAYLATSSFGRRSVEKLLIVVLLSIEVATIALGLLYPLFILVAAGYLLLLPVLVALLVPWATRIHLGWLALHAALVLCFAALTPESVVTGLAKGELIGLLFIATGVSQAGHVANLWERVGGFLLLERVRALNREAGRDRRRLDRLNSMLDQAAKTDAPTGLRNRLGLGLDLVEARSRIERQGDLYGLLMLDLDRFKVINDELGHVAGDEVLRSAAIAIVTSLRAGDRAYRFGGDEFVVLTRVTRHGDALAAAERIRDAVEGLRFADPGNPSRDHITVSIGVAELGPDDLAADDRTWLDRADAALYRAKGSGGNRIEVVPPVAVRDQPGDSVDVPGQSLVA